MPQREMNDAEKMVKSLCVQDESQLKELLYDMVDAGGIECVEKLFDAVDSFLADYEPPAEESDGVSDEDDYKSVDDSMRAREARAINRGEF